MEVDQETEDNELHSGDGEAEDAEGARMLLPDHFDTVGGDISYMVNCIEVLYAYVLLFGWKWIQGCNEGVIFGCFLKFVAFGASEKERVKTRSPEGCCRAW